MDDMARPQLRSRTRIPGRSSTASVNHSVSHSGLAPPLTLASIHSGLYRDDRGNRSAFKSSAGFISASATLRLVPQRVIDEHERGHRLDHRHGAREDARIMTATAFERRV